MKIDGGCFCGNITFEADINPEMVMICHCTDCQSITGSAFRVNVPVAKRAHRVLRRPAEEDGEDCRKRQQPRAGVLSRMRLAIVWGCAGGRSAIVLAARWRHPARNSGRKCRCGAARRLTGRWTYATSRAFPRGRALSGRISVAAATHLPNRRLCVFYQAQIINGDCRSDRRSLAVPRSKP